MDVGACERIQGSGRVAHGYRDMCAAFSFPFSLHATVYVNKTSVGFASGRLGMWKLNSVRRCIDVQYDSAFNIENAKRFTSCLDLTV